jgi:NAD(P)-dependent dehydrogenase (short-subunit alcohol dehydrogenase family)
MARLLREASESAHSRSRRPPTNPADLKGCRPHLEAFGGIDILVNNGGGPPRAAVGLTDEQIEQAVELLLLSQSA